MNKYLLSLFENWYILNELDIQRIEDYIINNPKLVIINDYNPLKISNDLTLSGELLLNLIIKAPNVILKNKDIKQILINNINMEFKSQIYETKSNNLLSFSTHRKDNYKFIIFLFKNNINISNIMVPKSYTLIKKNYIDSFTLQLGCNDIYYYNNIFDKIYNDNKLLKIILKLVDKQEFIKYDKDIINELIKSCINNTDILSDYELVANTLLKQIKLINKNNLIFTNSNYFDNTMKLLIQMNLFKIIKYLIRIGYRYDNNNNLNFACVLDFITNFNIIKFFIKKNINIINIYNNLLIPNRALFFNARNGNNEPEHYNTQSRLKLLKILNNTYVMNKNNYINLYII